MICILLISYPSYGLRFAVQNATETFQDFKNRMTKDDWKEGEKVSFKEDKGWYLGSSLRDRGSLHSDIWKGTAADLAAKAAIGVYPVGGWWKERPMHKRWDRQVRYSLIVSIRVLEEAVDVYTPVATLVTQKVSVEVES